MAICAICKRSKTQVLNRPHSLRRTKRSVYPNLQKLSGVLVCSRCRRTLTKAGVMNVALPQVSDPSPLAQTLP